MPAATATTDTRCPRSRCGRPCGWPSCPSFRTTRRSSSTAWRSSQPKTKEVAKIFRAIKRPDLSEAESAESVGETKVKARGRTLERRSILFGLPEHNPVFHQSARNIEGVKVAPVAEFNTYDILKQRYLILTREALAALKEQVKHKSVRRGLLGGASSPADSTES